MVLSAGGALAILLKAVEAFQDQQNVGVDALVRLSLAVNPQTDS